MYHLAVGLLALSMPLSGQCFAQSLSFGVKAGVPLTDAFSAARRDSLTYSSVIRRYVVGPTAEIGLPLFGLRVEADALYHRIGWDSSRAATPLFEPYQSIARIGAWDFDALLKHRAGGAKAHPYLGAGPAFRRFFTTRESTAFLDDPRRYISTQKIFEVQHKNIAGLVFSAGIEFGRVVRIGPEIRYTRWLMNNMADPFPALSTQRNQAEVLVSVTFGRH